ncbi:dUTP diphosphatase [Mangrovibacillus sp. Mu-81]|uniref:dUTP diphosphatase n=1 Tax=Mangrovibacillus sp. Mu-81 TaxID=3121478 RepID=UPI002FE44AF9
MKIESLLDMQKQLDVHIEKEHGLRDEDLVDRKILALLVEVGELANETRSFKFWSKKKASAKNVILEEYVDGIHFILSLGIEMGLQDIELERGHSDTEDLNEQFLHIYQCITEFRKEPSVTHFLDLFDGYLYLGELLGFTSDDVFKAYTEKNKVNYERQQEGY